MSSRRSATRLELVFAFSNFVCAHCRPEKQEHVAKGFRLGIRSGIITSVLSVSFKSMVLKCTITGSGSKIQSLLRIIK